MTRVAVTGASGWIGQALCKELSARGHSVWPLLRRPDPALPNALVVGEVQGAEGWGSVLRDVDCVVHCAARTHATHESGMQALNLYRSINLEGTRALAHAARDSGVKRFVFLSSVKVLGEASEPGSPLRFDSPPAPQDAYGLSKWEAEQALRDVAADGAMQTVIVRPPLVYGPGAKANFLRLVHAVDKGVPLPLASVHNKRSLVALDNLIDLLALCIAHPAAAGQTLMVSDGHDLSTPELVRSLAQALDKPARLLSCPIPLLRLMGRLAGRADQIERLVGNLQIDATTTQERLGWKPPLGVADAMQKAVMGLRT